MSAVNQQRIRNARVLEHLPLVRRVVDAFGPERCFWGSDLSHLPCPYREVVTLFTEEMKTLSARELEWIMGRGLAEWLDWPLPG